MPSCCRARPNCVGSRRPASCSSTDQCSSLRTKTLWRSPYKLSGTRTRQTALAMGRSATLTGRANPGRAQQTTEGFATEREAFLLDQFFTEVMVVEAGIGSADQM